MKLTSQPSGLAAAIFAFVFWGLAPIFFKQLNHVDALLIIAHRLIWGLIFLVLFLIARERSQFLTTIKIPAKTLLGLFLSGLLIVSNWLIFVWAVTHEQILATSLGYFINPLVNIILGTMFLQERLNRAQCIALLLAASATIYLGVFLGQAPWVALALAASFGLYGLTRKLLQVRPLVGLFWESMWFVIPALVYLLYANHSSQSFDNTTYAFLVISGLVTVLPLVGFNYAAKKLSLTSIGFLQYIAPSISFIIAVLFYGETFTHGHQVAFTGIWSALMIVSLNSYNRRKNRH